MNECWFLTFEGSSTTLENSSNVCYNTYVCTILLTCVTIGVGTHMHMHIHKQHAYKIIFVLKS